MKICIAGNSGHGLAILNQLDHPTEMPLELCGYCPGFPGENLQTLEAELLIKRGLSIPRFSTLDEMLEQAQPELVVIDGRFGEHTQQAITALEKGIHVFVDKPVATSLEDLQRLQKVQSASQASLFAIFTTRYEAPYCTAYRLIRENKIGTLRMLTGQKSYRLGNRADFYKDRKQFGGLTPWVSIHMLDTILWLTGKKCRSIYSLHDNHENRNHGDLEMVSLCTMELEDHILASVNTDYYRPAAAPTHGDDRLRIVGTCGILEIMNGKLTMIGENGVQEIPLDCPPDVFGDCLRQIQSGTGQFCSDGIYSTYISLKARDCADQNIEKSEYFQV